MSSLGSSGPNSWHALLIQAAGKADEAKVRDLLAQLYPREEVFKDALRIGLQRVVSRGHESLTRLLLDQGAEVNQVLEGEVPPLHRAAELGRENIVKLLLDSGANVNMRDKNQRTAIFSAAQKNHQNALQLLLNTGADVNIRDEDGQTLMLWLAAEKSEKLMKWGPGIIEVLMRTNLDLEIKDRDGRTALLWAAATGKETLVKLLLTGRTQQQANIHATNHRAKTALHLAVESKTNRIPIIRLLLENHANVHAMSDGGWTPLHNAAEKGYEDVAALLLEWNASPNATTSSGMTALHWCARNGHISIVKLLLQQHDIRIHRKNSFEETPMLGAAQNGHIEIVRLLSPTNDGAKLTPAAREACKGFQATVVDFGMEHRPVNHSKYPVYDLLYGEDEGKQKPTVTTLTKNVPAKPNFRWIHLPSNNIAWVETLFNKNFIENNARDVEGFKALEKILGQQHRGPTAHAFFMRPLCQLIPTGKDPDTFIQESVVAPESQVPIIVLPHQKDELSPEQKALTQKPMQKPKKASKPHANAHPVNTSRKASGNAGSLQVPQNRRESQHARSKTAIDKKVGGKGSIVLFMPYLHYETHQNRKSMSAAIRQASSDVDLIRQQPNLGYTCDEMLIHAAISTEGRDADQVVYRYTRDKGKGKPKKVFMVDQLWLWVLGKDLVITSFPQRWQQPKNDPLNVLDGIIEDMNSKTRPPVKSVHELAALITGRCSSVFDRHRLRNEEYQFLDMFESSIGQVTNRETELFMNFNDASKAAERWLKNQRQKETLQLNTPAGDKDHTFVDTLLDIGEETALLAETKDIRDELNMISMVLTHQKSVLQDMETALLEEAKGSYQQYMQSEIKKRYKEQLKVVEIHSMDVERMDKQAAGIYTSLTHLLDLKQKHANAFEARFARDQAAFTGRQGQTIMVFTLVTIVFLPMSFIAAVFAIPIRDFPHQDGNLSIPLSHVSKVTFGVGLAISIPLIAVALSLDNLSLLIRRVLRSMLFWRSDTTHTSVRRQSSGRQQEPEQLDSDDEELKPTQLARRSEDAYRARLSYDVEKETRPMRRSIYSKDRSFRDSLRASGDLERGAGARPDP
ncbi:MAG: hypothetical protein LQ348_002986 [Seirophora lacunosa]|nr:MAG: hypothetical protein LQ348_002986 [Seirophora lacunosa]